MWSRQPWLSPGHLLPPDLPASDLCGTLGRYKVISHLKLGKQGFPTLYLLKVRLKGAKGLMKVNQSSAQCRYIRHFFLLFSLGHLFVGHSKHLSLCPQLDLIFTGWFCRASVLTVTLAPGAAASVTTVPGHGSSCAAVGAQTRR